ncbi:MAG: phosphotransferase [Pseudomonadota bacterium]
MQSRPDMRGEEIAAFLRETGWANAQRAPLSQDASTRRYERLIAPSGETAMLMDAPGVEAPPCPPAASKAERLRLGWNASTRLAASRVDAFAALAGLLRARGLSAPEVYAVNADKGLALIEDFGAGLEFARLIERGAADETALYASAGQALAHLHRQPAPGKAEGFGHSWPILEFDALALQTNADLFAEWYPKIDPTTHWSAETNADWAVARDGLIAQILTFKRAFTLRDFHAENLVLLKERDGIAKVGLLDFQDAVLGWPGWDLAMLTQDARRHVSNEAAAAAVEAYCAGTGAGREEIETQLAVIGTLNALRISGLFARLIERDHKPRYRSFLPRQLAILARNLRHPAARDMAAFLHGAAPRLLGGLA